MKKSYLSKGIVLVMIGICFILAAVFTENVIDGLLWGLAGGALGPGIARIIQYFYWSAPKNQERYREIQEQQDINLHDELTSVFPRWYSLFWEKQELSQITESLCCIFLGYWSSRLWLA